MTSDDRSALQFRQMTETPIPQLILSLAAPTILSMLITSIYNLADTFFVGQISTSASGAVGVVSSLMAIIQALGFMLGHGAGTIISRSLGSRDTTAATRFASTSFFTALVFGVVLAVAGPWYPAPLHDAAGQHRDHPAPRLRLRAAHPHCRPADDLQPGDEQHPAL